MNSSLLEKSVQEQRFIHSGITWQQFKSIQAGFSDSPGVRLSYYRGVLEIVAVSPEHEIIRGIIALLLGFYFVEMGIEFTPTGSCSQEREGESSVQADESYCLGQLKPIPDLSIEVVITSGGTNKLEKYQALGVREVWFWEDGTLELYHLREQDYEKIYRSELLPELDLVLFKRCLLFSSSLEAVREFRRAITAK